MSDSAFQLNLVGPGLIVWLLVWLPCSLWLWRRLKRRLPDRPWRRTVSALLALVVMVVLPFGDVAWTTARMYGLCSTEAGAFVYRTAVARGYYDAGVHDAYGAEPALRGESPFEYVEGRDAQGRYHRYWLEDGEVREQVLPAGPSADYTFQNHIWTRLSATVSRQEWRVIDRRTGEVIARETLFSAEPGWLERGWAALSDSPPGCHGARRNALLVTPRSALRPQADPYKPR